MLGVSTPFPEFIEASLVLELLKFAEHAEDRPEWFPRGKWATIQALEQRLDEKIEEGS